MEITKRDAVTETVTDVHFEVMSSPSGYKHIGQREKISWRVCREVWFAWLCSQSACKSKHSYIRYLNNDDATCIITHTHRAYEDSKCAEISDMLGGHDLTPSTSWGPCWFQRFQRNSRKCESRPFTVLLTWCLIASSIVSCSVSLEPINGHMNKTYVKAM